MPNLAPGQLEGASWRRPRVTRGGNVPLPCVGHSPGDVDTALIREHGNKKGRHSLESDGPDGGLSSASLLVQEFLSQP